jgi:hypothetical protein
MLTQAELIIVGSLVVILPVLALISIIPGKFEKNDKLIWILAVLLVPILGPIIYLLAGRKNKIK